ncbi:MAG: GNAT family N-acetyltransferase [Chthoniobacterales bacterium]
MRVPERAVRKANADDVNLVFAFDQESAKPGRKQFLQRAIGSGNAYVAVQGGSFVGVGVLEYTFFEHGFISLVYVDPRERRTGVGELILRHLVATCRTSKIFSSTNLSNLPMQALFAKTGFKVSGMIHDLDPNDPEVIYYISKH